MSHLISKTELARLKKRSPAAVTKWIKTGKISAAALVTVDGVEKINLEQAERDLAVNLDAGQQFAQPDPANEAELSGAVAPQVLAPSPPRQQPDDEDRVRKNRADADRAEELAIAARRENAVEEGRWVLAEDAERALNRAHAEDLTAFELFLVNTVARDNGDRHACDWKAEATRMRQLLREFRVKVASDAAESERALEQQERAAAEGIDQDQPDRGPVEEEFLEAPATA